MQSCSVSSFPSLRCRWQRYWSSLPGLFTFRTASGSIKLLSVSPSGPYFGQPGYETDLFYLSCLAALVLGWVWSTFHRSLAAPCAHWLAANGHDIGNMRQQLRVARPVTDLARTVEMYCHGLALRVLASFLDHDGFDGIMVGSPEADYHLEFTPSRRHPITPSPTPEDLLVFYFPTESEWRGACERMDAAGFQVVGSFNPYWNARGRCYADTDEAGSHI